MAQTTEGASDVVEKIRFSFMTDEEVRRHSVVKITNPNLLDGVERPSPGGLYDPAMGSLDFSDCKTCGQRSLHCTGHCGHIELVSPVYNPLLFSMLHILLQNTCLFCLHFRSGRETVASCASQLGLIAKGDVIGVRRLDGFLKETQKEKVRESFKNKKKRTSDAASVKGKKKRDAASEADLTEHEDCERSHVSCDTTVYDGTEDCLENNDRPWDSFQFTEAMSVLNKFLKLKPKECSNCNSENPKIKKQTFGWLQTEGNSGSAVRANIIRGRKFVDQYSSLVADGNNSSLEDDLDNTETDSFASASDGIQNSTARDPSTQGEVLLEFEKHKSLFSGRLLPSEVREVMKQLWKNEARLCSFICDIQQQQLNMHSKTAGDSMFFLQSILVPPIKFRPAAKGGDSVMEHGHTVLLGKILQSNIALANAHINNEERVVKRWLDLQQSINVLYDSKQMAGQGKKDVTSGICQVLEKKEGIFRQKMMGKRVNFACRTVISPDPYLAVNEIGIPPYFALRLSYPERVTPWNVGKLRDAIINGPEVHPGAISYADKASTVKLPPNNRKLRIAMSRKLPSSRGLVTQSGKNSKYEFEGKIVYRHLQDGDIVLVNRQPTLHKPSIMAHVVRVLKGEKTFRMHYANCSSYNADFDGDEMNVHLPQDEISRAEAYNIVNANEQYIVPTKGDTVRGLIQDHIVSAVLITLKDTFFTLDEFNQLLYASGVFSIGRSSFSNYQAKKILLVDSEGIMQHVLPAVWKPKPLWTGKQVITALLNHLTRGCEPFSLEKEIKIPEKYFQKAPKKVQSSKDEKKNSDNQRIKDEMKNSENSLVIWKNELVEGVIDKAQFGQFGLVHTVQELYGSNTAGLLLSALSRLFTIYLQLHGFTCGVDDLIILYDKDMKRKETLEQDAGKEVHSKFVNRDPDIAPAELQSELEKMICRNRESATTSLDLRMRRKFKDQQENISKELLLTELLKPFPKNCISLMTVSGAKGGTVNFQQISSFLGQQDLEGKRVPRMVSGKTLPCFPPWDFTSRAGGYVTDRFLSGLRPQEYYFHCMAGREGLVDTAVKTSRSGYLQRCLVKNLESLKVCYDHSVRDADGSIVQFKYGEDGVDVHRTSFLKNFEALVTNQETLRQKFQCEHEFNAYVDKLPEGLEEDADSFSKNLKNSEFGEILEVSGNSKIVKRADFLKLVNQKYLSSLAPPGEPVGVIAAQSIGEPSTQMTLNTFHLAGRGEMNVTLGIPRLQEILMTASENIKTPVLTCPFLHLKSKDDANSLLAKMKKITVADIIESMEVHVSAPSLPKYSSVLVMTYKLLIKFKPHEFVSLEEIKETLTHSFLRKLEDAIQKHVELLDKIRGIKKSEFGKRSNEVEKDEEVSEPACPGGERDKDDDGDGDDETAEDIGSDFQKRKQQNTDEMDYDDCSEDESDAEESITKVENESEKAERSHDGSATSEDEVFKDADNGDYASQLLHENGETSEPKSSNKRATPQTEKKKTEQLLKKKKDRRCFVAFNGLTFEVHFKCQFGEPHLLLAQIAQKTAQKVYIEGSGKINECRMVEYDPTEKTVKWDEKKTKKHSEQPAGDSHYWALKAAGTDFVAFWEMQDVLDVTRVYSNNVHAVLKTYGVEAARRTILNEVKNVFEAYGVKVDYRHLSLVADYMTQTGGYRAMSRHGGIAESISPLAKMSFETAAKFIVEAASHSLPDDLETPSSRICLGLPVKMGTGCFDLMQNLEFD